MKFNVKGYASNILYSRKTISDMILSLLVHYLFDLNSFVQEEIILRGISHYKHVFEASKMESSFFDVIVDATVHLQRE